METDQQTAENAPAQHGNALQEINTNPTHFINGRSQLPKALETHTDNENLEPTAPEEDGIKYSENMIPADQDENSDQENLNPAAADIDVELQEKKKKRKKKSKSKRGLVKLPMAAHRCKADFSDGAEGKANGFRGVLC